MSSIRLKVFDAVEAEREYQRLRWGNPDGTEKENSVPAFLTYMQYYQAEATRIASKYSNTVFARDAIRKIVALGVACLEQHGVVERDRGDLEELRRREVG